MEAREIKFRAWHKIRKEMYNVHGWHSEFVFKDTLNGVGCEGNPDRLEDVELLESTGFKDIKGKEIFDGDILSHKYESDEGIKTSRQQVFWSEKYGQWRLDCSFGQDKSLSSSLWTELRDYDYEIVGNIHEQK